MLTRMIKGFIFCLMLMPQSVRDYPTKPVRLIEPFGAGGGPDLIARALGQQLSESWGQPVIVENHPGAGSTAGPALVAKSPADGYTLLVSTSAQAYSAALLKNLPYDPLKDFVPVAPPTSQPYVIVASKLAGITSVRELVAAAKAKPGELKFGSTGMGTGTHLGLEEFNLAAGIKAVHVPAGPGEAFNAFRTVSTDDAYVNGHVTFVAPRVPGQVVRVLVDDNNRVQRGNLLVQLDKQPYRVQVDIAKAALEVAQADLVAAQAKVRGLAGLARSERFELAQSIEQVHDQVADLHAKVAALQAANATLVRLKPITSAKCSC